MNRKITLFTFLFGLTLFSNAQQRDVFMQIAGDVNENTANILEEPQPQRLSVKYFNDSHLDKSAFFRQMKKMNSMKEFTTALQEKSKECMPYMRTLSPVIPSVTTSIPLKNFDWRIATDEDKIYFSGVVDGKGEWKRVTIPNYGPPVGKATTYYRTTFNIRQCDSNEVVYINFGGVDYHARVYVNGNCVGEHTGFFSPFEFNITDAVKTGDNVLLVEVDNDGTTHDLTGDKIFGATNLGYDDPDNGWHHCPPGMGIYQKVDVEIRPVLHISDIFVRPLPNEQSAEAWIEIENDGHAETSPIKMTFSVYGLNFSDTVVADVAVGNPNEAAHGKNIYRVKFNMGNFRWWNTDTPWLYTFQLKAEDLRTGCSDFGERHFGMRSFVLDENSTPRGTYYLNGHRIRLFGANTMGFEQMDVFRGDSNQLHDDLLMTKLANMNYFRITQRPVQPEVYDMADRLGVMIQTDFPLFGHMKPNLFSEGLKQVGEMERLIRSHPSCIQVTYMNERFRGTTKTNSKKAAWRMNKDESENFFHACDRIVHSLNPDRVIKPVDGDYDDYCYGLPDKHNYSLWYYQHEGDIGKLYKGYGVPVQHGWNYGCGEFGSEGMDRSELMRKYCPTSWLPIDDSDDELWTPARIKGAQTGSQYMNFYDKPHSMEDWIKTSRDYQAFATTLMTDAFRRDNRMVSFAVHLFIDAWPTGWMKAIIDVDRVPKPAFYAYREALVPLKVNIRSDRTKYYSGEHINAEYWVFNDTRKILSNPILKWMFITDGKVLYAGQASASMDSVKSTFQGFSDFLVPDVKKRSSGKICLALFDGKRQIHDTSIDVDLFPSKIQLPGDIVVYDRKNGKAARIAKEMQASSIKNTRMFSSIGSVDNHSVGKMSIFINDYDDYASNRKFIDDAVKGGATAIFFNLAEGRYMLENMEDSVIIIPFKGNVYRKDDMPNILSINKDHVLMRGFHPADFRYWYNPSVDRIDMFHVHKVEGNNLKILLAAPEDYDAKTPIGYLAEKDCGTGRFFIVTIDDLAERIDTNPTGKMLISKLMKQND